MPCQWIEVRLGQAVLHAQGHGVAFAPAQERAGQAAIDGQRGAVAAGEVDRGLADEQLNSVPASTVGWPGLVRAQTGLRQSPKPLSKPPAARPLTKVRREGVKCMPIQVRQLNGRRLGRDGCQPP